MVFSSCPTIAFCCDRLQTPSTALERPKYPQRSINYASGDFALSVLSTKFSPDLAANTILGQPPRDNARQESKHQAHQGGPSTSTRPALLIDSF